MSKNTDARFAMFDVTRFGLPDTEAVVASHQKNMEALTKASQIAVEGAQAVMRRQFEIGSQMLEALSSIFGRLPQPGGSADEWVVRHAEQSKKALDSSLTNARELAEVVTRTHTDALKVITKRVSESLDEVRDFASKRARGG